MNREDMVIDHVLPKCKGGEDNIFNYVLTNKRLNAQKNAKVDRGMIDRVLYIVRLIYVPKVIKSLIGSPTKIRQKKLRRDWIKQEREMRRLLGSLYYTIVIEKKPWITRADIDRAHGISLATFGMGLPFYDDVFGNVSKKVSSGFHTGFQWLKQ